MIRVKLHEFLGTVLERQVCRVTYHDGKKLVDLRGSAGELKLNKEVSNREISTAYVGDNILIILL